MCGHKNILYAGLLIFMLSLVSVIFPCAAAAADADQGIKSVQSSEPVRVFINDRKVSFTDPEPFIDCGGRIKAPARFIAQGLGANVAWDEEAFTALITGYKKIALIPGLYTATVDGAENQLDSSAEIINNRLYVPLRFIAEALGARVRWNEQERTANITTDLPIINNYGISYNKLEAGWYTVPRTFTAWVAADNARVVDFYLTPAGTEQEPVKIATVYEDNFSITYTLPPGGTLSHFWVVATNDKGDVSTEILNVYNEAGPEPSASIYGVPLHPSFNWSEEPVDGLDEDLRSLINAGNLQDGVKVIVSTWLQKPSSHEVVKWYQDNLEAAGWNVRGPAGGGSRWDMTAENNLYSITIKYVWGSEDNETGVPSDPEKGYRIVMVIKNLESSEQPDNTNIFTVVDEATLSDEQTAFVDSVKETKGIHHKDSLYVVALGEKPNPGYGLEIVKTEMSWEQAKVYVKLTTPDPDKMYAAVISYPYLVGKAVLPNYTTISFINVETGEYI